VLSKHIVVRENKMPVKSLTNEIDYDKCAANIGNRFDMVLVAALRARELKRGYVKTISTPNGNVVTALQEIQAGNVGADYLKRIK
jgi:DNA-directed RNA polymerase subunit omega